MIEQDLPAFRRSLRRRLRELKLPFDDVTIEEVLETGDTRVSARCTDDPLFHAPPCVGVKEDGSTPDGPWNHREVLVTVVFSETGETGRPVLLTTVDYLVDRDHANYYPLPEGCGDIVAVRFNWEFDRETLVPGTAEMRDGLRLHYSSVLPPRHVIAFVEACATAAARGR